MAIRLSGSVTRKLPISGIDYSSQSFAAGMEIEVNSADPREIQGQLANLYETLNSAIDGQIAAANAGTAKPSNGAAPPAPTRAATPAAPAQNGYSNGRNRIAGVQSNGNGNGRRGINATEAQCRAIYAICKAQGLDMAAVLADFNVADPKDLPIKTASQLIDQLKSGNGTAA